MNWFNNLNEKQKNIIAIAILSIGLLCCFLGIFITYYFYIPGIIFVVLGAYLTSKLKNSNKQNNSKTDENKSNGNILEKANTLSDETEKKQYQELLSNSFEIKETTSNFECSLMVMALNQISENKFYNPNDLHFNINEKIKELQNFGRDLFLKSKYKDFIAVDLETTGLSYETDKIIQICAVKVVNGEIVDTYCKMVNPRKHISVKASEKNGIYDEDVKGCDTIKKVLPEFIEFIGNSALVFHNEKFDLSFLKAESITVYGENKIKNKHICTMKLWRTLFYKYQGVDVPSATLSTLVINLLPKSERSDYYSNQHTASGDAIATAKVFMKMYSNNIEGE